MFTFNNKTNEVPWDEYFDMAHQLGITPNMFEFDWQFDKESVKEHLEKYSRDYWTINGCYVGLASNADAMMLVLKYSCKKIDAKVYFGDIKDRLSYKTHPRILDKCSEKYLKGLISAMIRKKTKSITPNICPNYSFTLGEIEAILEDKIYERNRKETIARKAPEELKRISTRKLLRAYRDWAAYEYYEGIYIEGVLYGSLVVKAVLDVREHLKKKPKIRR
jgi:hypothetical protein